MSSRLFCSILSQVVRSRAELSSLSNSMFGSSSVMTSRGCTLASAVLLMVSWG